MPTMNELNLKVNVSYGDSSLSDESGGDNNLVLFVLWGVLLPLVATAGLVGNVLTILVLWRREMNSTTILYLRGLVITDTGILLGAVISLTPLACANYLGGDALLYFKDAVYPVLHTPAYYVIMTLQQVNVWVTVSVSVERYIAICHPFRAARLISRRKTIAVMATIVAVSLLYNAPHLFATEASPCGEGGAGGGEVIQKKHHARNYTGSNSTRKSYEYYIDARASSLVQDPIETAVLSLSTSSPHLGNTSSHITQDLTVSPKLSSCLQLVTTAFGLTSFYTFYRTIMYLITIYVLPFLALLFLNSFLIRELMNMQRKRIVAASKEENEANLSLVLVLIVIVFIFCQTPGLISQFDVIHISVFIPWLGVSNLLFATNSAVNFLIYTAFGRKFRLVLLRVFRRISSSKAALRRRASSVSSYQAGLTEISMTDGNDMVDMIPLSSRRTEPADIIEATCENNIDATISPTKDHTSSACAKTSEEIGSSCFSSPGPSTYTVPVAGAEGIGISQKNGSCQHDMHHPSSHGDASSICYSDINNGGNTSILDHTQYPGNEERQRRTKRIVSFDLGEEEDAQTAEAMPLTIGAAYHENLSPGDTNGNISPQMNGGSGTSLLGKINGGLRLSAP